MFDSGDFKKFALRHLWLALVLGAALRLTTAFVVYGPQSVDDYSHGLLPAWEYLRGLPPDLPLWRSPLLVWTLVPLAEFAQALGLNVSFDIFRVIMMGLGLFSVLAILGLARYILRNSEYLTVRDGEAVNADLARRLYIFSVYMIAGHGILSFAMTRAFGESIATTLVLLGILWMEESLDRTRDRSGLFRFLAGASLLGIACLYRFQVGLLGLGFAVYLLSTKRWREFAILAAGGSIAAIIESLIDLSFGRYPLETLYNYFYVNKDGAVDHSVQPWYNTWMTIAVVFLFPFSLPLFARLWRLGTIRLERILWGLVIFFTFMHSLIPHKEERFLYPILPFVLILLARAWARNWGNPWEKWLFRPVFVVLVGGVTVLSAFSNSQSGEYEPILRAERLGQEVLIWDTESLLGPSFFRERLVQPPLHFESHSDWPTLDHMKWIHNHPMAVVIVTSQSERVPGLADWLGKTDVHDGMVCSPIEKIQSLADQFLYAKNPKYNVRRKPSWMTTCRSVQQ